MPRRPTSTDSSRFGEMRPGDYRLLIAIPRPAPRRTRSPSSPGPRLEQGYFFTREEIEALDAERVTDLLEGVPALREICVGRGCRIVSSQTSSCPRVPIYLDGALRVDSRGVDRLVTPAELAALEVYPRPVSLSDDFAPPSNRCGAIVLWSGG